MDYNNFKLLASLSSLNANNAFSYKDSKMESFQSKINNKYNDTTSLMEIEEEFPYGSGEFRKLICRVVSVRTVETGTKMSDSYKKIIFKEQTHPKDVGHLYRFLDNYWIAHNTNTLSGATDSIVIRKCNNIMRWIDSDGILRETPISFDEDSFYLTNEIKQETDRINGYRKAIIQRNNITKQIKSNQRFIFGSQCLKLSGAGVNDFLNTATSDDNSPSVIKLNFEYDYVNKYTDDLEHKIANAYSDVFDVKINNENTLYGISDTPIKFTATVKNNEKIIDSELEWKILSGQEFCEINQVGNEAYIIFKSIGDIEISVQLKNINTFDTKKIKTTNLSVYDIIYTPNDDIIYEGDTQIFEFNLYYNNVKVEDAIFSFNKYDKLNNYTYEINGNSLSITSNKRSIEKLEILCEVNYPCEPLMFRLELGGAW